MADDTTGSMETVGPPATTVSVSLLPADLMKTGREAGPASRPAAPVAAQAKPRPRATAPAAPPPVGTTPAEPATAPANNSAI